MKLGKSIAVAFAAAVVIGVAPSVFAQSAETTTYSYDALGRLKSTSTTNGPNGGTATQTEFDKAGNRTSYQVTGATGTPRSGTKVIVVPLNGYTIIPIPNPWAAR